MYKNNIFVGCLICVVLTMFYLDVFVLQKKHVSFDDAKKIVGVTLPIIEIEKKGSNKKTDLFWELHQMKKYILGIDNNTPKEIVRIQLGLNNRACNNRCAIRTNVEGLSSIYCIDDEKEDRVDKKDVLMSGSIKVTNETNYKIDVDELVNEPLKKKFDENSEVLIYHTHTNESYISNLSELNNKSIPPRSNNEDVNVVRVGQELSSALKRLDIRTIHDKRYHNVPSDRGAYARSLDTVTKYIKKDNNISITLDIHRDGISDSSKLRVVDRVDGVDVAKIMIVVGTNKTGLSHDNWRENLKFALKLQKKLIEYNPNIVKPVFISKNRYNQHLTNCSLLIEVGGDGNLIDESIQSAKYIARAIKSVYAENKR